MQASPRHSHNETLREAKVIPERLTKRIEVEGDSSKIQEQVRRFQEFKFREFSDNCKGCEAAASGTDQEAHR